MTLRRLPFERSVLDEEREEQGTVVLSVRINEADRVVLDGFKDSLGGLSDALALRVALRVADNVIRGQFGDVVLDTLFKNKRLR